VSNRFAVCGPDWRGRIDVHHRVGSALGLEQRLLAAVEKGRTIAICRNLSEYFGWGGGWLPIKNAKCKIQNGETKRTGGRETAELAGKNAGVTRADSGKFCRVAAGMYRFVPLGAARQFI
jgi:hypothetical protein